MTIFQDLIKVYDDNQACIGKFEQDRFGNDYTLLPASHVSVSIQIQVTIDNKGNFSSAEFLSKRGENTVIPATIQSANRASNPEAHPLQDKIKYVAGDYAKYAPNDKKKDQYRLLYTELLKRWVTSSYATPRLKTIYHYQQQGRLIQDLVSASVIKLDEQGQINKKTGNLYVRFTVSDDNPVSVWRDKQMYASWADYYNHYLSKTQPVNIDYLTGKSVPTTKLSEKNINPATSGAKLISANDKGNFTYRGMFLGDDFYSVGYLESQKMAHALKWLIQRQGLKSDSRVYLFWSDGASNDLISQLTREAVSGQQREQIKALKAESAGDTGQGIAASYNQRLLGLNENIEYGQLVHIIFLDAATTGRMATVYYNVMATEQFRENIETWVKNCGFLVNTQKGQQIHTPTVNQLIRSAYLVGSGGKRFEAMKKRSLSRMMIAIINAAKLPNDLLKALYHRLLKPQGYSELGFWRQDLLNFVAAENYQHRGGRTNMALNLENHDRSYLFGRLLALADDAENFALYQRRLANDAVSGRLTTAQRFMTNFSEQPATTWQRIYLSVMRSYMNKLKPGSRYYYQERIMTILDQLGDEEMTDEPLAPGFLTGFAAQHIDNHQPRENDENN